MNNSVFFTTEKGITQTSANYLANIAKEELESCEAALGNISFLNVTAQLMGSGVKHDTHLGVNSIDDIENNIKRIGKMHSFIAWMREAIKAKDQLLKEAKDLSLEKFCEITGLVQPEKPQVNREVTESDIFDELSVKERNRYYYLEAVASSYGHYIHKHGAFSTARNALHYRLQTPTDIQGEGRDAILYTYEPSISAGKVDSKFMELQAQRREYDKELNEIKAKLNATAYKRNVEAQKKYTAEYQEYRHQLAEILSKHREYITAETERIAKLKIVVPEDLVDTLNYLNSLGKAE